MKIQKRKDNKEKITKFKIQTLVVETGFRELYKKLHKTL